MPRINLLPWREEERKKRQQDFMVALGASVIAAIGVIALTLFAYVTMIDNQQDRNARLEAEIAELEKSITEIDGLERQKERLLARMEIIEKLQRSRPEVVHLFDEISRKLPEGVHLSGMRQTGSVVELRGIAQSSTRVSALMRRADESSWLTNPDLTNIETTENGPARQSAFVVTLRQVSKDTEDQR